MIKSGKFRSILIAAFALTSLSFLAFHWYPHTQDSLHQPSSTVVPLPFAATVDCASSPIGSILRYYNIGEQTPTELPDRISFYLEQFKKFPSFKNTHHNYCRNHSLSFLKQKQQRYRRIQSSKKYIAANLHNNEDILPDLMYNLLVMANESISGLGPPPMVVSIYESGSNDKTKCLLRILEHALHDINVKNSIVMDGLVRGPEEHRIEYLSKARNRALKNLGDYQGHVLFLNDVLFCVDDMYELLFQAKRQKAALTCGIDYWQGGDPVIYDSWVHRDIYGLPPRTISAPVAMKLEGWLAFDWKSSLYDTFTLHPATSLQLAKQLPIPVSCCWNGAAVINSDIWKTDGGIRFRNANTTAGECDQSECSLLCKDIVRKGDTKIMVVPRVKVSYDMDTFHNIKDPQAKTDYTEHFPPNRNFTKEETEGLIQFNKFPELVMCLPLQKHKGAAGMDPHYVVYENWLGNSTINS
ncbi:cryptococcal mannosyltransferase 1-domain-containing protein [Paraphysoderma sedebokerense]|nr:cryptococcal mannosyltransferase 1-domain-containing protein [Paraphysoderma sedebokerense]